MKEDEAVRALAIVHPTERSGLHTFWSARWAALQHAGIDVTLLLPRELNGFVPQGIPADHILYQRLRRPRSLRNLGANLGYLANVLSDARAILDVASQRDSAILLSHGPHFMTAAIAARMSGLPLAIFVHSAAAPSWSAQILRLIRRPDVVGYELLSTRTKFAPLFRDSLTIQLTPVLDPAFKSDIDQTVSRSMMRVGFVASFSPRKRVEKYLDVVEHPRAQGFDFRLIGSVASGHAAWWAEHLQSRVERLVASGRLKFIDGSEGVIDAVRELDALLITSDDEGVPNVAMEALSLGALIVSLQLEGIGVLSDQLPEETKASVRQVSRGTGEIDRLVDLLDLLDLLDQTSTLQRTAISTGARAATAPARGIKDLADAFRNTRRRDDNGGHANLLA